MNHEEKLVPTNISEIIEKMNENLRSFAIRETEWIIQKNAYESRIAELEGEVQAHEQINIDLMKRIKMLEYSLIQERSNNSKSDSNIKNKETNNSNNERNKIITENKNYFDDINLMSEEELNKIKEGATRPSLLAMLNELGINENFANELFTDLELNKAELERIIKKDIEERSSIVDKIDKSSKTKIDEIKLKNEGNANNIQNSYQKLKSSNKQDSSDKFLNNNHDSVKFSNNDQMSSKFEIGVTPKSKQISLVLSQNNYIELKAHFDVVRKLSYMHLYNYLISVSEDCLINIWNLDNLNLNDMSESVICLRGHTGPLFSLETKDDLIYTAGNEGIIKIWKAPKPGDLQLFCESDQIFNSNIAYLQKTTEIIWDLKHHPTKNILASVSSDNYIHLWKTCNYSEYLKSTDNLFLNAVSTNLNGTTCHYLNFNSNIVAIGLVDASISFMDLNKCQIASNTKSTKHLSNSNFLNVSTGKKLNPDLFKINSSHNNIKNQINTICSSFSSSLVYGGFEDGSIRYFDYRTENSYNPISAHDDAITSLNIFDDLYLFSTSHDSKIKLWDIRDLSQPLEEALGSQKKWDEAICDGIFIPSKMSFVSAGADSIVRIFKL